MKIAFRVYSLASTGCCFAVTFPIMSGWAMAQFLDGLDLNSSEIISDCSSLVCRRTGGSRIKHRVKENWLKMYDKSGLVLRVETVINNPEEFRVRKQVLRKGKRHTEWVEMRKGVAYLFRYREVSLQANGRYLDALAVVDDPTKRNGIRPCDHSQKGCGGPWVLRFQPACTL